MAKIIPFTGITKLDLPPDQILDGAKGKLTGLVIMGYTEDDEMYFASSYADGGTVLWLLEQCKKNLLGLQSDNGK